MKKLILSFAFIGLFSLMTPTIATPLPTSNGCTTHVIVCSDGTQHYAIVCDDTDIYAWFELLCP